VSIALLLGIQQLDRSFKNQLNNGLGEIDMVVGAKGSPLQLVLASVLHLDNPTGNIPFGDAQRLMKNPMIEKAVPISYGDNYKGYRIVGTTKDFSALYNARLREGRFAKESMEVVLGVAVAEATGLSIGDTFQSSHGLAEAGGHEHEDLLKVVGIYQPTYQVIDRLIVTGLETIWDVHDHEEEHNDGEAENHNEEQHHDEDKTPIMENTVSKDGHEKKHGQEITSLLVSFRNPVALLTVPRTINENTNMQAALPKFELERLYQFTGVGVKTITWIAYAILVISCITICISLYRMVRDRAFDLALMRSYGASTLQMVKMVAYEGFMIAVVAFVAGVLISQLGIYLIFEMIQDQYKQKMELQLEYQEVLRTAGMVVLMVVLSILFAIYPLVKMNISKILSHEK
jgi:putative ABC transport system permease protein